MRVKQVLLLTLFLISPLLLFGGEKYVATSGLNVRSGSSKEYPIVFTLQKGDEVEVLSKSSRWYKIRHSNKVGYANSEFLKAKSSSFDVSSGLIPFLLISACTALFLFNRWHFNLRRKIRRDYYRNEYLQSDEWQRKRYVVLKRDNWRCVYCGAVATQVHHKRYAQRNIGKEPIQWLVSVCKTCHEAQHS